MRPLALLAVCACWCACATESTPGSPCQRECGVRGRCAILAGHEECLCERGYGGDACLGCSAGFIAQGEACVKDPCVPNPCAAPHQTACQPDVRGFTCACDEDAQDHDHDGACRPTCALATQGYEPQACDDASGEALFTGPRTCQVVVRYDPGTRSIAALALPGEWNAWDENALMLKEADGRFVATLTLGAGDYAYKFYDPSKPASEAWFEDVANPYFKWVGGVRNSRLRIADCQTPLVRLVHRPEAAGGRVAFKVQFVPGADGAAPAAPGVIATRDGVGIGATYDARTGVLTIDDQGLAPGKYAYRFEAEDAAGRKAERLYVPVWVEDRPFDWRDAVLYFALTDRFADGDPTNNAPAPGVDPRLNWQGGDFAGLRGGIEAGYFEALGVSAIWVSSISQNTGRGWPGDFGPVAGYHSYWPISTGWRDDNELPGVEAVEPRFGTLAEFQALVQAAHARGLRILVDLVANHVHEDSPLWTNHQVDVPPWFNLPPQVCQDIGWAEPITCWFASYLPDLDHRNLAVLETLVEHARWLVEETDIDGFRIDAVKHMVDDVTFATRGRLAERLRFSGARFYMVGETFTGQGESEVNLLKRYLGPMQLDGQFDFPLYWEVVAVLLREERDLGSLARMTRTNDGQYGDAIMSTFLGNHDVCRALSHANGDFADLWCNGGKEQGWNRPPSLPTDDEPFKRLRLAWAFMLTSPGVPLIYYGDEIGMPGAGDPDNRRMMPWDGLSPEQQATLAQVQALAALRRAHPAASRGERRTLALTADGLLWAYAMQTADDFVVTVLNRSPSPRSPTLDLGELTLPDGTVLRDAVGGPDVTVAAGAVTVQLDGRTAAVLVPW